MVIVAMPMSKGSPSHLPLPRELITKIITHLINAAQRIQLALHPLPLHRVRRHTHSGPREGSHAVRNPSVVLQEDPALIERGCAFHLQGAALELSEEGRV